MRAPVIAGVLSAFAMGVMRVGPDARGQAARQATALWTAPNVLSAARLPLAMAFPIAVRRKRDGWAVAIVLAAAGSDVLDGYIARRRGQVTPLGAVVDGLADKAFGLSVVSALVVDRRLSPQAAFLLALRELIELPLAVRVLAEQTPALAPTERRANALGKVATMLELIAVLSVISRARRRRPWIAASAIAGTVAALSYWAREAHALRQARRSSLDVRSRCRNL